MTTHAAPTWGTAKHHRETQGICDGQPYLYFGRRGPKTPDAEPTIRTSTPGGVAMRFWAAPLPAEIPVPTETLLTEPTQEEPAVANIPTADAHQPYLDALIKRASLVGRPFVPVDLTDDTHINSRYARELLALAVDQGLAEDVESDENDGWQLTAEGHRIAALVANPNPVFQLNQTGAQGARNAHQEIPMASTKTETKPAAKAAAKPIVFRKCGCGCNADVAGKTQFRQGHDARMVSQLTAAIVGSGASRNKNTTAVVPPAFTPAQGKSVTASTDIQARINEATDVVTKAHGPKLGAKVHNALMNGWTRTVGKDGVVGKAKAAKAAPAKATKAAPAKAAKPSAKPRGTARKAAAAKADAAKA